MPSEETLATFEHPARVYSLQYPALWESLVQEEGRSCGFGPRDRDDVGLWISILPLRADTDALRSDLPALFEQAVGGPHVARIHQDPSLRHFALKGENTDPPRGGDFWLVAGGDVLLLASTQFPPKERDVWAGPFDLVMASLHIARDDEVLALRVTRALLERLRHQFPDHGYTFDGRHIRGGGHVISPENLVRQVRAAPRRQAELIEHFVAGLVLAGDDAPSADHLDAVRDLILPILKPSGYVRPNGPTASVIARPWLGETIVCYAIRGGKTFRLVLRHDCERWGLDALTLHELALGNLARLPWPRRLGGGGGSPEGRLVMFASGDGLDATRLIDPRLHGLAAPVLGSPFLGGAPDRDTLVLFPAGDAKLFAHVRGQVRRDFARTAYPVSPHLFRISSDGVAVAERG